MFSSHADLKRPHAAILPTTDQMVAAFKKPRLNPTIPSPANFSLPPPTQHYRHVIHNVPENIVPIVAEPFTASDFFADVNDNYLDKYHDQIGQVIQKFPPPAAPLAMGPLPYNGVGMMVPFVYPPIPVLRPDKLIADPIVQRKRGRKHSTPQVVVANTLHARIGVDDTDLFPVMAPLPFPPPNYMPYPLIADHATLTPSEVFSDWLTALEHLPRTDMVVASAAGSIFDLRAQAEAAGLTIAKLDRLVQNSRQESDPEGEDDRSDSDELLLESRLDDYIEYAEQVDTSNAYDRHARDKRAGKVVVSLRVKNEFGHVEPLSLNRGRTLVKRGVASLEYSDRDIEGLRNVPVLEVELVNGGRDISNATGSHKERRRQELLSSTQQIAEFTASHKAEMYAQKKMKLLTKLRALQRSRIQFDDNKSVLGDKGLREHVSQLQTHRDMELLRLKLYSNYEKLKLAQTFYHSSNKAYKSMNSLVTNKLQKLRHFLEYQKRLIHEATDPKAESDLLNIRSKESAKLYEGFAEIDYSNAIKEIFRAALHNEDHGLPVDSHPGFDPDYFRKVFTDREHLADVNDLMPLVTEEEFKLIVGDAPQKTGPLKDNTGKAKSARHPIFQSPLYDQVTSGSDTNASDSNSTLKRRPGRRAAPKPVFGEQTSKQNTEAALVAKIMKQFVGPAAASADELTNDLGIMGVDTKWPVK